MQKTESWKQDGLHLAILAGVALAIGVYLIATSVLISKDGVFYISQARTLPHDPLAVARRYPIGYPFLLFVGHKVAGLFAAGDSATAWAASSQAVTLLCRMGALMFLYLLGRMLVGARRSFWAVLILIVLPYPAHYGSDVLRAWPFLLFLGAGFWLLLRALRDRKWWMFALVGLDAGLGYLIRPMCGQLVLYGLLALAVAAFRSVEWGLPHRKRCRELVGQAPPYLALLAGFAMVTVPYFAWTRTALPHQLRPVASNSAPVISAVGGKSASDAPLPFRVDEGQLFEAAIEASDPDGDPVTFSVVAVPLGSRPVYRFRSLKFRADFWTISEGRKDSLLAYPRHVWDYAGIDYYAYGQAGMAPGLEPVYRCWSPVTSHHFYTIDESELRAVLESTPEGSWVSEGVAFYAFPEGRQPPGSVPVYRFRNEAGQHFWAVEDADAAPRRFPADVLADDGIAWYAHAAGPPPVDSALEGATFRWWPGADQQGEHQLNAIVSDGRLQRCQLVRITVGGPGREGPPVVRQTDGNQPAPMDVRPSERSVQPFAFLLAAYEILGGVCENLMVFFFLPLCLGLYYRLRHEAGHQERALMIAVVVVNVALMVARYVWIEPGSVHRYSVGLIALTVCYIPVGVELMARWLRTAADCVFGDRGRADLGDRVWFYVLVAIGVAICVPKLLTPMGADKKGYRDAAAWLRDNTAVDAVVAVPDRRISFYAEREGRFYQEHADPRQADYIVAVVTEGSPGGHPEGWSEEYSCWADAKRSKRLTVYRTP